MKNNFHLFCILAALCSPTLSSAAKVTFQGLALTEGIEGIFFKAPAGKTDVSIPAYSLSEPYTYDGNLSLEFFRDSETKGGKPAVKVATALLPKDCKRVLLVFAKDGDKYACLVIPDEVKDFPRGSLRFFNGAGTDLAVRYNQTEAFQLPRAGLKVISQPTANRFIEVATHSDGEWKKMISGYIKNPASVRRNVLLVSGSRIKMKYEDDIPPRDLEMLIVDSVLRDEAPKDSPRPPASES